ncbi:MAG TPA: hypothetical protein VJK54_09720 [Chthoniobacterales bacterium]|nr:hypothetical protein [Chthoniobacterales bacterium]
MSLSRTPHEQSGFFSRVLSPQKKGSQRLFNHHPLGFLVPLGVVMSVIVCLSGCSSLTDATESAVGAGAGAAAAGGIGYAASHGNLLTTAMSGLGGAAGGGLLTSLFQSRAKKQKVEENQKGYDQGKSDTVKSLHWVARSIQKPSDEPNELRDQFLQVTQEGRPDANIGSVPYEVTLPVQI